MKPSKPNKLGPRTCFACGDTVRNPTEDHYRREGDRVRYICGPCSGTDPSQHFFRRYARSRNVADWQYHGDHKPIDV